MLEVQKVSGNMVVDHKNGINHTNTEGLIAGGKAYSLTMDALALLLSTILILGLEKNHPNRISGI